MKKALLIATYDSFLRTGLAVANNIENIELDIKIRTTASNQLSEKQLSSIFNGEYYNYEFFFMSEYKKIDFNQYDIIILSAGNNFIENFFKFYLLNENINRHKIVTVSLFPGVIFGDIDSIACRMSSDILLLNNEYDLKIAQRIKNAYSLNIELINYGLPVLKKIDISFDSRKKKIFFFEQVKIPETLSDRMFLIKKLVDFALKNPLEEIIIKPRVSKDEKTVHINKYPIEKLLEKYAKTNKIPNNLSISHQSIEECFSEMKLGITISSTVGLEAIYNNIPMVFISDFGIRKDFANSDFLESGCFISFDEIGDKPIEVNKDWHNSRVYFSKDRKNLLNKTINNIYSNKKMENRINTISTKSIDYVKFSKQKNYKQYIIKALKNPLYLFSVVYNIIPQQIRSFKK